MQSGDLIIAATPLNGKKYDMRTSTDAEISQAFSGGWNTSVTLDVIRNLYTVSLGDTVSVTQISMKKDGVLHPGNGNLNFSAAYNGISPRVHSGPAVGSY